ncbi:MAG: glycogen/starch/alpha-glucan phosphorylase [Gudongella sp.]|nr:glycogen/starch/alpha-glucan phosphorylase [Gudongella sp.]
MTLDKNQIGSRIEAILYQHAAVSFEDAAPKEVYRAVGYFIREILGKQIYETKCEVKESQVLVYLSMDYLPGSLLQKNIDYLCIYDDINNALKEHNWNLDTLFSEDREIAIGYSDLGYLANGLLDTFAADSYKAIGYGLLYREGYFKQVIKDGEQIEEEDDWWERGKNWLYKCEDNYNVRVGGRVDISGGENGLQFKQEGYEDLLLRTYDLPYVGYSNKKTNYLRLFENKELTKRTISVNSPPNMIKEKLKQEYLLVSGTLQDVIRIHKEKNRDIKDLNKHFLFLMLDAHLLLSIPELMRILMDEYDFEWNEAWDITKNTFFYAPIITIEESFSTLESSLIKEWLPRLWLIIEEINYRYLDELSSEVNLEENARESSGILWGNELRLKNIASAGAFQGPHLVHPLAISHRRWLLSGNPPLSELLKQKLGDEFIFYPQKIKDILEFKEETSFLSELQEVKQKNKNALVDTIYKSDKIVLNPYAIFDGHLAEIKESNRQLLEALWIIEQYLELKMDPNKDCIPRVIFLGGKAVPYDQTGKLIIKLMNDLKSVINSDFTIKDKLKIIFIEDLSLKTAEKIYPALDTIQSLTLPTKEGITLAGLTGMVNGAVEIGSLNDTNLLLRECVGEENINLFGISAGEVEKCYDNKEYNSQEIYYRNKDIRRAVDALTGKEGLLDSQIYRPLYDLLLKYNDHNFVLRDFKDYKEVMSRVEIDFLDSTKWNQKMLSNIALSADFSSDVVVSKYVKSLEEEGLLGETQFNVYR